MNTENPEAVNSLERLLKAVKMDYSKRVQAPKQARHLPWELLEFFTRQFEWDCHVRARYHIRKVPLAGARAHYLQRILFAVTVLATTDCERVLLQNRQVLCGQ